METKSAKITLGYYKQGDDFMFHLQKTGDPIKASLAHAEQMTEVADHLQKIAKVLSKVPKDKINVYADTHHIGIEAPSKVIDLINKQNLAELDDEEYQVYNL
ncbi:MAG: hypothetical protein A2V67_00280 [Deltaproteobacteria bacterium RBG_13_61_14]|nr:MAG: hypothetical protein A2V67_00280 [Deltaproteobacteria bacterium RBG_13_61_14]